MAKKPSPRKTGRPTVYTEELGDYICNELVSGRSLRSICTDEGVPPVGTVLRWLAQDLHVGFREQYAKARELQADALFDETLQIADTQVVGRKVKIDKDGNEEITEEDMIAHRRLQIDVRKWIAGKLRPKVYGEKTVLTGDKDNPLRTEVKHDLSDAPEEVLRYLADKGRGEG